MKIYKLSLHTWAITEHEVDRLTAKSAIVGNCRLARNASYYQIFASEAEALTMRKIEMEAEIKRLKAAIDRIKQLSEIMPKA